MLIKVDWRVVTRVVMDKTVVESPMEFIEKHYYSEGFAKISNWMFNKTVITICKCRCGKIKRYVTKIKYNDEY